MKRNIFAIVLIVIGIALMFYGKFWFSPWQSYAYMVVGPIIGLMGVLLLKIKAKNESKG